MAYQSNYLSEEEKKKQEGSSTARPTSGVVDSMTQQGGATGASPANVAPKEAPTPGTGFVNLQQYLDLNKGEGGRLAGEVTKDVAKEADAFSGKAKGVVDSASKDFSKAQGSDQAETLKQGLQSDASAVYDQAADFLGAGYAGPLAADKSAVIKSDATAISDKLGKVDDKNVQAGALQKQYGSNGQTYTQGFGLLDQFLLGGTESGRNKIAEVKGKAKDVGSTAQTTEQQLAKAEADARAKLSANKQAVLDTAGSTRGSIEQKAAQDAAALSAQNAGKIGGQAASVGDVLDQDKVLDLEALTALQNAAKGDWYSKTFKQGENAPVPVVPEPDLFGEAPGAGSNTADANNKSPFSQAATDASNSAKGVKDTGWDVTRDPFDPGKIIAHDKAMGPLGSIVKPAKPGAPVPTTNGLQKTGQKVVKGAVDLGITEAQRNKKAIADAQAKIKADLEMKKKQAASEAAGKANREKARLEAARKTAEEAARIRSIEDARRLAEQEAARQAEAARQQAEEVARQVEEAALRARDEAAAALRAVEQRVQDQAQSLLKKLPKIKAPKLKKFW